MDSVRIRSSTRGLALFALIGVGAAVIATVARGRRGESPGDLANQARDAIQARQWARAESLLDRLGRVPAPPSARGFLKADLERGRGRADVALGTLAGIGDAEPLAPQARLLEGQIERERDRMPRAEAALLAALRLDPSLVQARRELVYIYGMQARRAALNDQFRALAEVGQLNRDDLFLWTSSNQDVWVNPSIRTDLERFLAADPEDRWSRLGLAAVLLQSGRPDEAAAVIRPLAGGDVEALALRARIALEGSRPEEARALLKRAPAEHPVLSRLRGELAMRRQDWSDAVQEFRTAVRLDPTSLQATQSLALALTQSGEADEAASVRERAERLRRLANLLQESHSAGAAGDRTFPRRLGGACEAVGQLAEARAWYRMAIALDPLDAGSQKALYRLSAGPRQDAGASARPRS